MKRMLHITGMGWTRYSKDEGEYHQSGSDEATQLNNTNGATKHDGENPQDPEIELLSLHTPVRNLESDMEIPLGSSWETLERKSSCDFCRLVSKSGGMKNEEANEKKDVTHSNVCSDEELANPGMRKVNTDSIVTTREKGRFSMTVGAQAISVFLPFRRRRVEIHRLESRPVIV